MTQITVQQMQAQKDRLVKYVLVHMPEFGRVYMHLNIEVNDTLSKTWIVTGSSIVLGRKFFAHTEKEQVSCFLHASLHVMLQHAARRGSRHPRVWNWACDLIINNLLQTVPMRASLPENALTFGHKMLEQVCYQKSPDSWTAEALYLWMMENLPRQETGVVVQNNYVPDLGEDDLVSTPNSENEEDSMTISTWNRICSQALAGASNNSLFLRLGKHLPKSQIPWRLQLRRLLLSVLSPEFRPNYSRPCRAHLAGFGPFEPSYVPKESPRLVGVVLDTSGSCWDIDTQQIFAAEIGGISRQLGVEILLINADTEIKTILKVRPQDNLLQKMQEVNGGGGTDLVPAIEEAQNHNPSAIVVLSDGYLVRWPKTCTVPLFWVLNSNVEPPIGRKIQLETQNH